MLHLFLSVIDKLIFSSYFQYYYEYRRDNFLLKGNVEAEASRAIATRDGRSVICIYLLFDCIRTKELL